MFTRSFSHLAVVLLAASQLAQARPHGARNVKREVVVQETVTVYVDQFGRPIDINNKPDCIVPPETSAPVVVAPPSAVPQVPAPPAESKAPDVKTPEPVPEPPKEDERTEEKEPEPAPSPIQSADPVPTPEAPKEEPKKEEEKKEPVKEEPSASKGPSSGRAITYSPYNPKPDGSKGRVCKSEEEIKQDVSKLSNFGLLRLYSTDCNQISLILKHGQHKLFVGLDNSAHPENELKDLLRTVKKDGYGWDRIDTVSLGNEVTDFNKFPGGTEAYANKINEFRGVLRAEGYNGPVVGADTFNSLKNDPNGFVCKASDYVAANAHAYFDTNFAAEETDVFLRKMMNDMKTAFAAAGCTGKEIRFTECGWPTAGAANGKAIPSLENQRIAISKTLEAFPDAILFTAFDDLWKEDRDTTKGTEKHWGIGGVESL